ncbi:GTP-binding protein [Bremerella sp. JC817]|uniref:GTP-binding protein n=1 Tax=Bremerella sp. JC817 TaxID=3231756 RepID=UPI0034590CEF
MASDTPKIRFVMIGGFLGAGKTTTIGRLAQTYQDQGLKVGVITNDQAADLVDTNLLRSQGLRVGEVAGACFCCNFNELTSTVETLSADQRPDVVIAEPVGSCTDLVATVVQPLMKLFDAEFDVAPYGVILKPSHGLRILRKEANMGFSPKAAYIFEKQLEEADFLIINRIDELSPEQISELSDLLAKFAPETPLLRLSAKTGEGMDGLIQMFEQRGAFGQKILDLDYDVYAEGEAELGWLNSSMQMTSGEPFALDDVLLGIVEGLRERLASDGAETAHLKTIGLWEGAYGVANLVSSDTPTVLSLPSNCTTKEANVVVNARVAVDPETLRDDVQAIVNQLVERMGITVEFHQTQSFRPGRPVPTHRFSNASS